VATGSRFKQEANVSAESLRRQMPDANTTVFCDHPAGLIEDHFDDIRIIENPKFSFYDKIFAFLNSPYENTVFIDTDTYVCAPLHELFEILERFDLAAVRDHWSGPKSDCPLCFDDFNTGLVAFQNTPKMHSVFQDWEVIYRGQIETNAHVDHDQPAFRSAIYKNKDVSVYVLSRNYNIRLTSPVFLGIDFNPKILHGRSNEFERLQRLFASSRDFRFFLPNGSLVDRTKIRVMDKKSGLPMNVLLAIGAGITRVLRRLKG
jgi:hypothetical protein